MKTLQSVTLALVLLISTVATADVSGDPEKLPGYVLALESDASGATVRGSLSRLVRSVRAGADIKLVLNDTTLDQSFACDSLVVFSSGADEHLACTVLTHATLYDASALPNVVPRATPYFTRFLFTTTGPFILVRTTFSGADAGTTTGTQYNLSWYAKVR